MTSKLLAQAIASGTLSGNSTDVVMSSNGAIELAANNGTDIFIAANNNVGIGNTTPADALSVQGSLYTSSNTVTLGTGTYFVANGNVGIGVSSPLSKLYISSGTNDGLKITDGTVTTILYNTSSSSGSVGTVSNHGFNFYSNNMIRMSVQNSGDVVIGNQVAAGNTLRYFDLQNTDTGSSAGTIMRFITANSSGGSATTVDMVKYKNGSFYINNNDGSGTISLGTAGSDRMIITAAGKVGIGTTNPGGKFSVYQSSGGLYTETVSGGTSSTATDYAYNVVAVNGGTYAGGLYNIFYGSGIAYTYYSANSGQYWVGTSQSSPLVLYTNNVERMRITAGGAVGIGSSNPNAPLSLMSSGLSTSINFNVNGLTNSITRGGLINYYYDTGTYYADFWNWESTGIFRIGTAGNERVRVSAGGDFCVGKTDINLSTPGFAVTPQDGFAYVKNSAGWGTNLYIRRNSGAGTGTAIEFNYNGTGTGTISITTTTTAYNTSSDISLKQNIKNSLQALPSILALPIRQFDWKVDGSHTDYGLVAQEVEPIAPEVVTKGDVWAVDYGRFTPRLIKAFQEMYAELKAAKLEIAELKNK